jgi:hypothetical protein
MSDPRGHVETTNGHKLKAKAGKSFASWRKLSLVQLDPSISTARASSVETTNIAVMTHSSPGSSSLPGPVTASGAQLPTPPSSPIALTNLHPSGTFSSSSSVSEEERRKKAWKYEGYDALSKWMASENDFFLFRRFESLNAETILYLQYRITQLEERLKTIHNNIKDSDVRENRLNSSFSWDAQYQQDRSQTMTELSYLLLHYSKSSGSIDWNICLTIQDQYIEAFSKIRARPRAEQRQIDNLVNWLKRGAITEDETHFANHKSDLISIHARSRPPLGRWLEACQKLQDLKIFKAKSIKGLHIESDTTSYSSDKMFERFTTLGIIFTGLVMLLAPMWWLECVEDRRSRLKIITGFVIVFILAMTTATINKPFEVVAATAAYAAVLMVFMQIDGRGG